MVTVKNLRLKTIIGINPEERTTEQEILINYQLAFDSKSAEETDDIHETVDYKKINKAIIAFVTESKYLLLEKLTREILDLITKDPRVTYAKVEVDKPGALRYADSVSFTLTYGSLTEA